MGVNGTPEPFESPEKSGVCVCVRKFRALLAFSDRVQIEAIRVGKLGWQGRSNESGV